ncbi:MAG: hypothetical protein HC905_15755 [Bacteroidales bacterium]|nr:hypothetical protein [Bacteroidales bacterium]
MEYANCITLKNIQDKKISILPEVSVGFDLVLKSGSRLYLKEELGISSDKVRSSGSYYENYNYITEDFTYHLNQTNFSLSNRLVYNWLLGKTWKSYFGGGLAFYLIRTNKAKYSSHVYGEYTDYTREKQIRIASPEHWISFPISVGFTCKNKLDFNFNYFIPVWENRTGGDTPS